MQVQHFKCSRSRYIYIYEKLCSSVVILIHPKQPLLQLPAVFMPYFQSYVGITQINIISQWWSVMSCKRRHMWGSLAELDSHKRSYTQQHQCTQKSRLIIIKVQPVIEPFMAADWHQTHQPPTPANLWFPHTFGDSEGVLWLVLEHQEFMTGLTRRRCKRLYRGRCGQQFEYVILFTT